MLKNVMLNKLRGLSYKTPLQVYLMAILEGDKRINKEIYAVRDTRGEIYTLGEQGVYQIDVDVQGRTATVYLIDGSTIEAYDISSIRYRVSNTEEWNEMADGLLEAIE
jgi:hypothetical protein